MKEPTAFEDAVDLLEADHKVVKRMFMEYASLDENGAPTSERHLLALNICQSLTIHAQLEEEIFYPQVKLAIGDDALMDHALQEHAEAKDLIARIEAMKISDGGLDEAVKQLGLLIDQHLLEEREHIFLRARLAALDLRGMTLPLQKRQQQLKKKSGQSAVKETA